MYNKINVVMNEYRLCASLFLFCTNIRHCTPVAAKLRVRSLCLLDLNGHYTLCVQGKPYYNMYIYYVTTSILSIDIYVYLDEYFRG